MTISDTPIILASNSPRRRELLDQAGIAYVSDPADVDESVIPGETPEVYAVRLALAKASSTASRHSGGIVLGADTIVVVDGEILGKPSSPEDAARMLTSLSGKAHKVITGVALVDASDGRSTTGYESTSVRIRDLSAQEIAVYVATGEPMDKAGGYGIQGRASVFVEGITGCFFNVVGLPLARVWKMLREFGGSGFDL
jgi:septum formation protein